MKQQCLTLQKWKMQACVNKEPCSGQLGSMYKVQPVSPQKTTCNLISTLTCLVKHFTLLYQTGLKTDRSKTVKKIIENEWKLLRLMVYSEMESSPYTQMLSDQKCVSFLF